MNAPPRAQVRGDLKSTPPRPFTTDGCSGGMSWLWLKVAGKVPPWNGLCILHDKAYWRGGPAHLRLEADRKLRDGVRALGHPVWAEAIYRGVRAGGVSWLPTSWRWGYGWAFPQSGPPSETDSVNDALRQ